jgi:hypothetical protein
MMMDWKIDYLTADILDGAIHKIGEHNFSYHGCFSPRCKNLNLIQTSSWRNWCSSAYMKV